MILLSYISVQISISLAKFYRNGIIESEGIQIYKNFYTCSKIVSRNHVLLFIPTIEGFSPLQFF